MTTLGPPLVELLDQRYSAARAKEEGGLVLRELIEFIRGETYLRAELHKRFGGQSQYGISTPAGNPVIFLFPGLSGSRYGYEDGWTSDGLYRYSGEGQVGDMTMTGGNRAIREHSEAGKDLHLFQNVGGGNARYEGHMVYVAEEWGRGPDRNGDDRAIVHFFLAPIEHSNIERELHESEEDPALGTGSAGLDELRARAKEATGVEWTEIVERRRLIRRRSVAIRLYALRRAAGNCEACAEDAPFSTPSGRPFLEVHHLRRLGDGGPDDPEWVAAICPNCHRRVHYASDADTYNNALTNRVHLMEGLS
jgi:5-methylcytosine-specific restriction protein A